MRYFVQALGLAAAIIAGGLSFAGPASAQYYYYDRGYYPPPPPPPPGYYGGPRYGPPGFAGWRPAYVDRHGQQTFYPRPGRNKCPRGYTVQDGVCKPYRGY